MTRNRTLLAFSVIFFSVSTLLAYVLNPEVQYLFNQYLFDTSLFTKLLFVAIIGGVLGLLLYILSYLASALMVSLLAFVAFSMYAIQFLILTPFIIVNIIIKGVTKKKM
ncbi:MAG: hypothetical protein R3Y43_01945 [Alphaproteobacteria bacterium]